MNDNNSTRSSEYVDVKDRIGCLNNLDIRWDGTIYGVSPIIVSESARQLLKLGDVAIPGLLEALEEESKFVAAHVLLTLITAIEYHTTPWNGLTIELLPDGQTRFDALERFELARRWRDWFQCMPRTKMLF